MLPLIAHSKVISNPTSLEAKSTEHNSRTKYNEPNHGSNNQSATRSRFTIKRYCYVDLLSSRRSCVLLDASKVVLGFVIAHSRLYPIKPTVIVTGSKSPLDAYKPLRAPPLL